MQISSEKVKEFQSMYHAHFGVEISEEAAVQEGKALILLLQTMKNEYEKRQTVQRGR